MFYVLDLASNETIELANVGSMGSHSVAPAAAHQRNMNDVIRKHDHEILHAPATTMINAPKTRSRHGCLPCKRRRKKCNEEHPICSSCKHRNVECTWRTETTFRILKETHQIDRTRRVEDSVALVRESSSGSSSDSSNEVRESSSQEEQVPLTTPQVDDVIDLIQPIDVSSNQLVRSPSFPLDDNFTNFMDFHIPSPLGQHIFQPFQFLDDQGLYFLDGFIANVARKFSIGQESSNYILKTFYQLSEEQESIALALAAWGGIFLEGGFTDNVNHYLNKAITNMSKQYPDMNNLSKKDVYILLNYFLIFIGLQVCGGDVYEWNQIFDKSIELVKKCGGLNSIVKMFDCSNEIKWLLSDIQFHDVLSLQSFHQGTSLPMEEYNAIFKEANILELGNYGLDPFQGCIQPIFLVLGEIISKSVDLRKKHAGIENSEDFGQRMDLYNEMNECFKHLEEEIMNCVPNVEQMRHIRNDRYEIELHLTLFDVMLIICQLCLNFLLKKLPANTLDMQVLLLNCLKQVDFLIHTKMKSALSFVLLVCGITCCTDVDRQKMLERFKIVSEDYKAANLTLIRDIVQKVWERNQDGKLCVDWLVICEENNWDVSFC
ncbi:hypothetical protein Cantr_04956 [Candida viswanathii]|uniref:Zn(2)-C6 fungal-type domain-containing protein n=1 Tax=Candida viswanathii TaxID=5486 RepID=A0A367XSS7_9ASCO|nr:hypothetical protein Cantr_04956 [Candida viswanathii]